MKILRSFLLAVLLSSSSFAQAPAHISYYTPDNAAIVGNNVSDWSSSIRINQDAHSFWVGGSHRMWIRANGSVGIGTSNPNALLDVAGGVRLAGGAYLQDQANSGLYVDAGNTGFRGTHTLYTTPWGAGQVGASYGVTFDGTQGRWEYAIGSGSTYGAALLFSQNTGALLYYSTGTNSGSNGDDAQAHMSVKLLLDKEGNLGIGTTSPSYKLTVSGGQIAASRTGVHGQSVYDTADLVLGSNVETRDGYGGAGGSHIMLRSIGKSTITALDEGQNLGQISYQNLRWTLGEDVGWGVQTIYIPGNVGVGTTTPTHKLAVNGTIKAKEVIVETTGWSDYVFADGYVLAPLAEVEAHIKEHKHLPGIPSAAQVAEQGVSVGDMQARLLAKIEELTLHVIAQEKELSALHAKVQLLESAAR